MLCDVCNTNEAKVFLTQIVEGKMKKVNICEACSKAKGVSDPTGFALADLLHGLGASKEIGKSASGGLSCPSCGFSQSDFKKTGRLGCSACYDTFAEGLQSLLKAMHKGTTHVGKVPARAWRELEVASRLKDLRGELDAAVQDENYEEAARLRDEIRRIEQEAKSAP